MAIKAGPKRAYNVDLTGKRFGRFTVVRFARRIVYEYPSSRAIVRLWEVRCDCGTVTEVFHRNLTSGHSASCGCVSRERAGRMNLKHGHARVGRKTAEYSIWCNMLTRCYNESSTFYRLYGGRGITVCNRWHDYTSFFADMGRRTSDAHSIDRIDNNGNYEPGNCRWATIDQQVNNTTVVKRIPFNGELRTYSDLAAMTGIKRATLKRRLRSGMSVELATSAPLRTWPGARQPWKT
jgi:hypothetical protein